MCTNKRRCIKCRSIKKKKRRRRESVKKRYTKSTFLGGSLRFNPLSNIQTKIQNKWRSNALKPKNSNGKRGFDLHGKTLGIVKKVFGKRGMVPPPYKYLGPGNPLHEQVKLKNGKIVKYKVKPYNKLDQIASKHDVCYGNNRKSKNQCDYEMLQEMKRSKVQIPRGMGTLVKGIIGAKLYAGI